ncbi:MAG: hypothetical protein IJL52_07825 [Clostridia bacterium]|nr:hypothetical protein [Clostridia bacterium]
MKNTKKLLSVLLAALLLAGCCALAFSAVAAGSAYPSDNVVVLPYDTDGLKDGDWYFDLDAFMEDEKASAAAEGHELTDDEVAAEIDIMKKNYFFLYDPTSRTIYYFDLDPAFYYPYGGTILKPGDDSYADVRLCIKQYQAPAPTDPGTPAPAESVCPWCGGTHEGFFQGIVGWIHGLLANIFGAKY